MTTVWINVTFFILGLFVVAAAPGTRNPRQAQQLPESRKLGYAAVNHIP